MARTPKQPADFDEDMELLDASELVQLDESGRQPVKLSQQLLQAYEDDDIQLTVSRKLKNGRKTSFLFEVEEYEDLPALQTLLRDEYGGGDFFIEGRRADGSWALKRSLTIEAPVKREKEPLPVANNFESVLLAMQESSERASRENRDLMIQMQQQQQDSMRANMDMVLAMMKSNQPRESMGITEILSLITTMQGATQSKSDPIEMLLKGLELGKDIGGGGDESVLQTAIKAFGNPLAKMAEQAAFQEQSRTPFPAPAALNPPAPVPQPSQQPLPESNPMMLKALQYKDHFSQLFQGAVSNGDPRRYADSLIDNVDEDVLEHYVVNEDRYKSLFDQAPEMRQYQPWLDKVRQLVIELLNPTYSEYPDNDAFIPDRSPVNSSHVSRESEPAPSISAQEGNDAPTDY